MKKNTQKNGSAILLIILFLAITSLYLSSILRSAGFMLEIAKRHSLEVKKTYAAEGLARIGIEFAKNNPKQQNAKFDLEGGKVIIKQEDNKIIVEAEFQDKKVVATLQSKSFKILSWKA